MWRLTARLLTLSGDAFGRDSLCGYTVPLPPVPCDVRSLSVPFCGRDSLVDCAAAASAKRALTHSELFCGRFAAAAASAKRALTHSVPFCGRDSLAWLDCAAVAVLFDVALFRRVCCSRHVMPAFFRDDRCV
jgi:hypothetical protein